MNYWRNGNKREEVKKMNKIILLGNMTREPKTTRKKNEDGSEMVITKFDLAVNRRNKHEGNADADFFHCTSFGRQAEFVEKYTHKGTKVIAEGEIRTGSYTNREGRKVYTTEIYVSDIEFAESKAAAEQNRNDDQYGMAGDDGFMNIPDGEELPPFN